MPLFFPLSLLFFLIVFILGLEFGSFANVCIFRWPRNQSVLFPLRSHCPWCNHRISWWENIPTISFVLIKGKCLSCKSSISWRYPFVEILLPLLWLTTLGFIKAIGLFIQPAFWITIFSFLFVILVTTLTDIEWKIIPDAATYFLILIGLTSSPWNPFLMACSPRLAFIESTVGAVGGASVLWLIGLAGKFLFGKEAMGLGDVKLIAGFGSLFGWRGALSVLLIASVAGSVGAIIGISANWLKRHQYVPFGPFLNFGALLTFFWFCLQISSGHLPGAFTMSAP